jgi:O-antigen/teichoic acid export membrane protein
MNKKHSQISTLFPIDLKGLGSKMSYATIGSILEAITFPLIIFPFLSRVLTNHDFGQVLVLWSLVSFLIAVIGGNLPLVIYRRHKDFDANKRKAFFGKFFWLATFISVGISLWFIMLYKYISFYTNLNISLLEATPFLIFMGIQCINGILRAFLGCDLQFKQLFIAQVSSFIGSAGLIISYYYLENSFWSVGILISPIVYFSILLNYLIREQKINLINIPDLSFLRNVINEVFIWIIAAALMNFVIFGDRWIMALLGIDFSQIAAYSIAVQANMILIFVANQVSISIIPIVSNMKSLNQLTPKILSKVLIGITIVIGIVLVGGSILGPIYIKLFYGNEYWNEARDLFYIMLLGISIYPLQIISRGFLIRFYPPKRTLLINLCGLCVLSIGLIAIGSSLNAIYFSLLRTCAIVIISIGAFCIVFVPVIRKNSFYKVKDEGK